METFPGGIELKGAVVWKGLKTELENHSTLQVTPTIGFSIR